MVDSGATGTFVSYRFIRKNKLQTFTLKNPVPVKNVDGTLNLAGRITQGAWLTTTVNGQTRRIRFLVTALGPEDVILGYPWLRLTNPDIDWEKGTLKWRPESMISNRLREIWNMPKKEPEIQVDLEDDPEHAIHTFIRSTTSLEEKNTEKYTKHVGQWIRAKINPAMALAQEARKDKATTLDDMIPKEYHTYKSVFEKKASERFPPSRSYDHAIDFKPGFVPKQCKVYPLTPKEETALEEFLEENLRKGYIRKSKSEMASPFFFIPKKNRKL